jgi:Tol biopolymer transport system component
MMKKIAGATLILILILLSVAIAALRVKEIHHLISGDLAIREDVISNALGVGGGFFMNADWSPDGKRIAFDFSTAASPSAICLVKADGTELRRITEGEDPSWSPDGNQIALVQERSDRPEDEIWIMNADGTNRHLLTDGSDPDWGNNGKIVFAKGVDLWSINPDGSGLQRLTDDPEPETYAEWSPDGNQIAFTRDKQRVLNIWKMAADGSSQMQLTTKGGMAPSWSSDGQWIAFESDRWGSRDDLWAVKNSKAEDVVHLATGFEEAGRPAWSPDGKKILFEGVRQFKVDDGLFVMTLQ